MTTIKDIAKVCGTSYTTVSHVINKSRYVSPEIVYKVNKAIEDLHYTPLKKYSKLSQIKLIGVFICTIQQNDQSDFFNALLKTFGNDKVKIVCIFVGDKVSIDEITEYEKMYKLDFAVVHYSVAVINKKNDEFIVPTLLINSSTSDVKKSYVINFDYTYSVNTALSHLLSLGHTDIAILGSSNSEFFNKSIFNVVDKFLSERRLPINKNHFWYMNKKDTQKEMFQMIEQKFIECPNITAIISTEINLTVSFINYLKYNQWNYPEKISLITIDDTDIFKNCFGNITRISIDVCELADSIKDIYYGINSKENLSIRKTLYSHFQLGDSTSCLARDCFGNKAAPSNTLELSMDEIETVKRGDYKICISLNDAGTMFSQLVLQGIKETATSLNIAILSVADAQKNDLLHDKQLKDMGEMEVDAIISFSNNHTPVQDRLFTLSNKSKILILGVDAPISLPTYAYATCIATNEKEKGRLAAKLLARNMIKLGKRNLAFICNYDINFCAKQRDLLAINTIIDEFPGIEIICRKDFTNELNSLNLIKETLKEYPNIEGMYIFNANTTIETQKYLQSIGRTDILLVTTQINYEIAKMINSHKNVLGIISSQPYEMGRCLGLAVANSFLHKRIEPYIVAEPIMITSENMKYIWAKIAKNRPPNDTN